MARSAAGIRATLWQRLVEFVRFSLVGGVSFALDAGALVVLRTYTPVPLAVDTAVAFALGALLTFVLSRQWVFPNADTGKPQADLARYVVLIGVGLGLTTLTVPLLARAGLDYRLAKLVASLLVALLNFVVMPRWVFRGGRPARSPRPGQLPPGQLPAED
ncbi:MAG: GtrA family protein [Micromonosporaceae bacterium]|nr:GtrA family protein [Micromonosporaceae bacterium]